MAQNISIWGANYTAVPAVTLPKTGGGTATFYDMGGINYALSNEVGGNSIKTNGILFGAVDGTSTATAYTVTIEGVTEYYDGLTVMLRNGVVTSASGFTVNINGLGAKPCYNNMATGATPTRDTTIFNANYTMLFVYSETLVSGGAWICYRGYNSDNNTIGYQLRTNSTVMTVTDTARYYKLYFTSADNEHWVPASVNSTNNATAARPVNQRPINPFGRIVYTSASTSYAAGANLAATTIWTQYALVLGYSFNRTGAALNLTVKKPVYVKCAPQSDGSAIMDADIPIVQDLPTAEDGKIYIYLGIAYDATHIELFEQHPVYYYKDGAIRPWTNQVASGGGGAVDSVNGQTGVVVLDAEDVGALPDDTVIPTKTSDLTNDSNFITAAQAPVQSVNGQTGAVTVQATLVSGTNIKTINNESLLGSGNITIQGGGGETALTDAEIEDAVDDAFSEYLIEVSLTNPAYSGRFNGCDIFAIQSQSSTDAEITAQTPLASFASATGSQTVSVDASWVGVAVLPKSYSTVWYGSSNITTTGGASFTAMSGSLSKFSVSGDGGITINGIYYDSDN